MMSYSARNQIAILTDNTLASEVFSLLTFTLCNQQCAMDSELVRCAVSLCVNFAEQSMIIVYTPFCKMLRKSNFSFSCRLGGGRIQLLACEPLLDAVFSWLCSSDSREIRRQCALLLARLSCHSAASQSALSAKIVSGLHASELNASAERDHVVRRSLTHGSLIEGC